MSASVRDDYISQFQESEILTRNRGLAKSRTDFPMGDIAPGEMMSPEALINADDQSALDIQIRRTRALLRTLKVRNLTDGMEGFETKFQSLINKFKSKGLAKAVSTGNNKHRDGYLALRKMTRAAALSNKLLGDFDDIVFIERDIIGTSEYDGNHMCDQYFGHNGKKGGGLYLLKNFKSDNPQKIELLKDARVPSGINKDKPMSEGNVLSPELSWDGKTIVFAWSSGGTEKWVEENRFNLFQINIDGTGLKRLTNGDFDDFDPCFLPNGRIAFISTRRGGYGRCHLRAVPTYTLHSMKPDGSDIICLSYHETNEWQPSVAEDGMLLYTRWDYIDRDFNAAHHIWVCYPDGRDPRAYHGNYATPLSTIEGKSFSDGRKNRPYMEYNARCVPGSNKFAAVAGPHHGQGFGALILVDQNIPDDNAMSQVKRITSNKFPEAETGAKTSLDFGTPWPLSEEFYLVNNKDGIYLLDNHGNKDLIYKSSGLRPIDPIPVRPRKIPPILPAKTAQGDNAGAIKERATISVMNVNITDAFGTLPKNRPVKQLRIIQVLPKTTPISNKPSIGPSPSKWGGNIARQPLGVVPVEDDGSVYFYAPIEREIYFQLLDEKGMAVQSMRSGTYVHAGEHLSCVGCHENKWEAIPPAANPRAFTRAPSSIKAEIRDQYPFGFYSHVKPIFDKSCIPCHKKQNAEPKNMGYPYVINKYAFYFQGGGSITTPIHSGSRTLPGKFGASFSKMGKALMDKTHQDALASGAFSQEDVKTIILWLDCNSDELSAFIDEVSQKQGKRVAPDLDWDPKNPTGIDLEKRLPVKDHWTRLPAGSSVYLVDRKIIVRLNGESKFSKLTLFDVNGRAVWKASRQNRKAPIVIIPGHTFGRGVFFLSINQSSGNTLEKLVLR